MTTKRYVIRAKLARKGFSSRPLSSKQTVKP